MKKATTIFLSSVVLLSLFVTTAFTATSNTKSYSADGVLAKGYAYANRISLSSVYGKAETRTFDISYPDNGKIVYWIYAKAVVEYTGSYLGIPWGGSASSEKALGNTSYVKAEKTVSESNPAYALVSVRTSGTHKYMRSSTSKIYTFTTRTAWDY